jgi:hypothetical protein
MATVEVFIHTPANKPGEYYLAFNCDMSAYGYVMCEKLNVEFKPLTREELIPLAISELRKKQEDVRTKAQDEILKLDEQVRNLLALNAPEVS